MAITAEEIFDLDSTEEGGLVIELRRKMRLAGLSSTTSGDRVAEVLSSGLVPFPGSSITINTFSNMTLRARRVSCGSGTSNDSADVDLIYRRIDSDTTTSGTSPRLRGSVSVKEIETAFDRDGNPFELSHTWAMDDKGLFPNGEPRAGVTEIQNGTIRVLVPIRSVYGDLLYTGDVPGDFQAMFVGRVNSTPWQGGDPRTWLCFGGEILPIEETQTPQKWIIGFRFEHDPNTWDDGTTVTFIDPNTGRPPVGVVEGTGWKNIQYYQEANFNAIF